MKLHLDGTRVREKEFYFHTDVPKGRLFLLSRDLNSHNNKCLSSGHHNDVVVDYQ